MSIKLVITRGFGNGTFLGAIKDIVLRGYKSFIVSSAGLAAAGSTHIFMAENVTMVFKAENTTKVFGPENVTARVEPE